MLWASPGLQIAHEVSHQLGAGWFFHPSYLTSLNDENMALPAKFADLKATIANAYPGFEENATRSWAEILRELEKVTKVIKSQGVNVSASQKSWYHYN